MVLKWLYQERGYLSQHVLGSTCFQLMLGSSSHHEVFCKKVVLKNFGNSLGNNCAGVSLGKLQGACNFQKFSGVIYFVISQKRKHFNSSNSKSKASACTSLKLKFYLKSDSAVHFLKIYATKFFLIFAFTVFLADSLHLSKIDFIIFNVSQKSLQNVHRTTFR